MTEQDAPLARREPADLAPLSLDQLQAAWLDAKFRRSKSEHTRRQYERTFADFRALLHAAGLDLNSDARRVAPLAQGWAGKDKDGNDVAPATFNKKLAVLSSFYEYATKQGAGLGNPLQRVERATVDEYANAEPLDPAELRKHLQAIDRDTPAGLRDYAILAIALTTGRRVAELASLRWKHVRVEGARVILTFERAKGGKVMRDALDPRTSKALMTWLQAHYGQTLGDLAPDAPLWPALRSGNAYQAGDAVNARQIHDIVRRRLGTHPHALRHSFAKALEDSGAKVSEIQARLGHSNLATTGRYLAALGRAESEHREKLAQLFLGND